MGAKTKISYVDSTWNPHYGCEPVSPGCANCFADRWATRMKFMEWGRGKPRRLASEAKWREAQRWNEKACWVCDKCGAACNVDWIRSLVRQCDSAGVPVHVKQLGSNPTEGATGDMETAFLHHTVTHWQGGDPYEWPADLRPYKEVSL